jgi:hypothetical protein
MHKRFKESICNANFSRIKTRFTIIQKLLRVFQYPHLIKDEFEGTKGVTKIRISKKSTQHNDQRKRYNNYLILFCQARKKYKMLYTENGVITTLEFIIDNIYVEFGGHIYFHRLVLYIKH